MNLVTSTLLVTLISGSVYGSSKGPKVTISDGKLLGAYSTSYDGNTYMEFLGIPYAAPPVGKLRFRDPEPVNSWTGTKIANKTTTCLQLEPTLDHPKGVIHGDEDCLHINVYVPGSKINAQAQLDVIVFIHGGVFMFGNSDSGGPKFMMDRQVILVSMNYRVGLLGFLSTGDKYMSGNYGLKDQVLALTWVQNNIGFFGGNPNSVTLHGYMAGGASVHYHYLSPLSRGLFHKGISSSGNALNSWALDYYPLEKTQTVAKVHNCSTLNTKKLADCLREQCAISITKATQELRSWLTYPYEVTGPIIDAFSLNPFLPKNPYQILVDKDVYDVPWIFSYVSNTGAYSVKDIWISKSNMEELEKNWCIHAPDIFGYRHIADSIEMDEISIQIKKLYLGNGTIDENTFPQLMRLSSDRSFTSSINIALKLHADAVHSHVRGYYYNYISDMKTDFASVYLNISCNKIGTIYRDDLALIYTTNGTPQQKLTKCDEDMKDFLLDLLTGYAKYGRPEIYNWTPIGPNNCACEGDRHLYIGREQELRMIKPINLGNDEFWQNLPINGNSYLF